MERHATRRLGAACSPPRLISRGTASEPYAPLEFFQRPGTQHDAFFGEVRHSKGLLKVIATRGDQYLV